MTWKWLIPKVIISPLRIGLWDPSKRPNFMAYKWVDPDHLQVLGWSSKLTLIVLLSQSSCWEGDFTPFRLKGGPCSGGQLMVFWDFAVWRWLPLSHSPSGCHWYRKYLTAIAHPMNLPAGRTKPAVHVFQHRGRRQSDHRQANVNGGFWFCERKGGS